MIQRKGAMVPACVLALCVGGCATYHPLPLAQQPDLAANLAGLRTRLPTAATGTRATGAARATTDAAQPPAATAGEQSAAARRVIDVRTPLDLGRIGLLAILNDPELRAERGQMETARAGLVQASVLPNPSVNVGIEAPLGGDATTTAWSASLSQDITSLVTYRARRRSARAHVAQVDAELLWQEWQVAQKARLLALDLYWQDHDAGLARHELRLLSEEVSHVRTSVAAGNLDLTALAPLFAAKAAAEQSLATANLARLQNWQALDALLGLQPQVRFAIARPSLRPLPRNPRALIAALPARRPDLVALQVGYRSADQQVRAAILKQFPALVLGGSWDDDNTNARGAGPNVTFDLPIFDRNQGGIAQARATRLLLHEQYQARLDSALADVHGLVARTRQLSRDLNRARKAAAAATSLARTARMAYAQGNLDQRTLTDFATTALQRQLEADSLERSLGEDRIALDVELGIGLPKVRIAPAHRDSR